MEYYDRKNRWVRPKSTTYLKLFLGSIITNKKYPEGFTKKQLQQTTGIYTDNNNNNSYWTAFSKDKEIIYNRHIRKWNVNPNGKLNKYVKEKTIQKCCEDYANCPKLYKIVLLDEILKI
jgi:transposase-like protein